MDTPGPLPQPGILDISPYIGGDSRAPGTDTPARLASNENPLGASPDAAEAYARAIGDLHRYPDGSASALRAEIGARYGLDPAQIVCGAGSDELFALLATSYAGAGDQVLYSAHGFLAYPIAARAAGAEPVTVPENGLRTDVDAILAAIGPRTRIIFIANPNNPTGSYLSKCEVLRLVDGAPTEVLIVLDAAYAEYVGEEDYSAGHELVAARPNVVVTHTFSKIYGLGGVRLGWAYCPPAIADVLNRVRQPFNVNGPAMAAGVAALRDSAFVARSKAHVDQWRPWLADRLAGMGFAVYPAVANFLLVSMLPYGAEQVRLFLKDNGVLVRQMGTYGLSDCLRITIGTEDELERLVAALQDFIGRNAPDATS
jgi:histidinol-phosphate aminotransferase